MFTGEPRGESADFLTSRLAHMSGTSAADTLVGPAVAS